MRMSRPVGTTAVVQLVLHCFLLCCLSGVRAADLDPADVDFFERRVRPLLVERCVDCHSRDSAESGLSVESRAGMLRGGLRGPAIVPGDADGSLLIRAVRHGEALKMPAKEKLTPRQIQDLVRWIQRGAPWPDMDQPEGLSNADAAESPARSTPDVEPEWTHSDREFWSFQPVEMPAVPRFPADVSGSSETQSPIDAFVLERLQRAGLTLSPPADRRTLIRRLHLDLVGIPPTPAEVRAFVADPRPDAVAQLVERLLGSPLYGQRWGRHWLDVARYADSNGLDENLCYANAHRYRNYVIDAFNRDLPFNQFLKEQLAGDVLPDAVPGAGEASPAAARLTATGFLCLGPKMLAEDDPMKMQMDIIDEQLDTIGRAFMGLTLGCARCHHHKFDPISMHDYYGLAGILKSTRTMENFQVVARWQERTVASSSELKRRDALQQRIDAASEQMARIANAANRDLLNAARRHVDDYLLAAWYEHQMSRLLANAAPLGPTLSKARDDNAPPAAEQGVQLIEAEDFVRGNVRKDFETYGKGIGVLVNQGQVPNRVDYEVTLPRAGMYRIELRYAAAAARPCQLFVNQQLVKRDAAGLVTGSWQPDGQEWEIQGLFAFQSGKNVIRLQHEQFFPHIDKLLLVPAPEAVHNTPRPFDPTYARIPALVSRWSEYLAKLSESTDAEALAAAGILSRWSQLRDAEPAVFRRWARAVGEQARRQLDTTTSEDGPPDHPDTLARLLHADEGPFAVSETLESHFPEPVRDRLQQLRAQREVLQDEMPELPRAMAVSDQEPEDLRLHYRGSHLTLGPVIRRRLPGVLVSEPTLQLETGGSGRRELAEWMASDSHPLTPRVIVNRVWLWHFGEGLVRSPDNFGRLGERPTHPELLDWLTARFIQSGWSLKQLHREILLSSTWQQSSTFDKQAADIDPENRLLWRMPRRRMDAEVVRDSLLAVAGTLDPSPTESLLTIANRKYVTGTANVDPVVYDSRRLSVYLPVVRSAVYDVLQAFDFADPSMLSGQRQTTTVAAQALFMMNSAFVDEQTAALAKRLVEHRAVDAAGDAAGDDAARVGQAWEIVLNRPASESEIRGALDYLEKYKSRLVAQTDGQQDGQSDVLAWQSLCRVLVSSNEFMFID